MKYTEEETKRVSAKQFEKLSALEKRNTEKRKRLYEQYREMEDNKLQLFTCDMCNGHFTGKGHTNFRDSTNGLRISCDDCMSDVVTHVILKRPRDLQVSSFAKDKEDGYGDWYYFEYDVITAKGTTSAKYDVVTLQDELGRTIFSLDSSDGDRFSIYFGREVRGDDRGNFRLVEPSSPTTEAIQKNDKCSTDN